MDLEPIRLILKQELEKRRSHDFKDMGNKYNHGLRTARLTLSMRRKLFPDRVDQDNILTIAAWFHDICNGEHHHEEKGAELTHGLLKDLVPKQDLDKICYIVSVHDDHRGSYDPLIKVLQDADLLDHLGAYDIILTSAYGITRGEDANQLLRDFRHSYEILTGDSTAEHNRTELYYDLSRELFDHRLAFQRKFIEEYAWELEASADLPLK